MMFRHPPAACRTVIDVEAAAIGRTVQYAFGFELPDVGPAAIEV
jgi:hypothetical protein